MKKESTVKLIDFVHARQVESKARFYRSTVGYGAPVLLDGRRHSRKTDAYAVGKTLLALLKNIGAATSLVAVKKSIARN